MRLGQKIFDGDRASLTGPQLVGLMTGVINEKTLADGTAGKIANPEEDPNAV
jgi:hypothetical protein